MPFANFKLPKGALNNDQKRDFVHRTTAMMVEYFGEDSRAHTMVLIEDIPDGGYGRADEIYVVPAAYRAADV